jgi:hypothetical protein
MSLFRGSRYADVPLFDPGPDGTLPFKGLRARPVGPSTGVIEHTVAIKERLDQLAHQYYDEPRHWYRIVEANPDVLFPEDLLWDPEPAEEHGRERLGAVIVIPKRREGS